VVYWFAWNSAPSGSAFEANARPPMPKLEPSWPVVVQVTTKCPAGVMATSLAPPTLWYPVVYELTWKSVPTVMPLLSNRCPKTPLLLPSRPLSPQTTTKFPRS
jgi:hypothetical protein